MSDPSRQLVAIMFTDIVGYTSLMGDDEQKAHSLLNKNRKLQKPLIDSYGGKWIKELGDGVLATFSTVSDAVYCAAAIQQGSKEEADLNLRIGIHLGEVMFQDGDVFGDGVNIASRLESLAPSGGIIVSESVSSNIQNKQGIETKFLREIQLKNVKDLVRIYEIKAVDIKHLKSDSNATSRTHSKQSAQLTSSTNRKIVFASAAIIMVLALAYFLYLNQKNELLIIESDDPITIAVLSFDDQSPDGNQEWLGDGMADEILNVLAKVNGLHVTGKTSSFSFKGKDISLAEIGRILSVQTILEGSVSKVGNKLRITAQLISVEGDKNIWSNKYDRDWGDVFMITDDVAQRIAGSLISELSIDDLEKITIDHEANLDAYPPPLREITGAV